jgi:hypothetical protein
MDNKAEVIRSMIEDREREIAELEAKYGTGVRPSWVGEDIGMMIGQIRNLKLELEEIEK